MRLFDRLVYHWPTLRRLGAALLALALFWSVRETPLQPAPLVRVDALSAFFIFALSSGLALMRVAHTDGRQARSWRLPGAAAALVLASSTTLTPLIAAAYLLCALLLFSRGARAASAARSRLGRIGDALLAAPDLVAAGALLVGYGALAARGALFYDERTAGAALDGFAFWFVLLAAAIPIAGLGRLAPQGAAESIGPEQWPVGEAWVLRIAWLYPLARLYSLGPWNNGWSFAALLLGGGAALWSAAAALTRPAARHELALSSYLGLALAGLGLGTSAGIAAGCYCILTYLLIALGATTDHRRPTNDDRPTTNDESTRTDEPARTDESTRTAVPSSFILHPSSFILHPSSLKWLLSGAVPFTAPFIAAWMLVGASVAGGVALLAGAAWLVMLLNGLTIALASEPAPGARRPLLIAAGASLAMGVGAPLVLALIQPVIEQLQGGLTPYGDVNLWPWVGLAMIDAAHTQVTTLPSIAVVALMLVLSALVYLIVRLRDAFAPGPLAAGEEVPDAPADHLSELLAALRDEVPWLGRAGPRPTDEERRVDGE